MTDNRTAQHEFMVKCLNFSVLIFNHIIEVDETSLATENTGIVTLELAPGDWANAYDEAFGGLCTPAQADELVKGLVYSIQKHGPTACAVWTYAHYVDHVFEDKDTVVR